MKRQKKSEIDIQEHSDTDRLSDLPDHLLLHIIEFMDIEHSVQTCALSKRWKGLWKSCTNLMFSQSYFPKREIFNKLVSQVLSGRDNSLPLHNLKCSISIPSKTALLEVMKYAVSHNVQQLTVIVGGVCFANQDLELPPSIFYCHSLTFLKLDFDDLYRYKLSTSREIMFPKSLNLPALKTLHLISLSFTTSDDNGCSEPFSTCNMLSTLVIMDCLLQDDAQTLCISNSNVTSLTHRMHEETNNYKVVFCTPKLTSLNITGPPTFLAPSAYNLPFLEQVNVDYTFFDIPFEGLVLISWLQLLANVKIITLGFDTLEEIISVLKNNNGSVRIQHPYFARLKSLKVELSCDSTISSEEVREMITYLLQNSLHVRVDIIQQPCMRSRGCAKMRQLVLQMFNRGIHDDGGV